MYEIKYKYGHPSGSVRSTSKWVQAKDEQDARNQTEEILRNQRNAKTIGWHKITAVTKIA